MEKEHIMYERYYESIGVKSSTEKSPKKGLLVEMEDLNKSFAIENEKAMK